MNILLTLFLLFLVILLLFSNLKYRNKFTNYDNSNSVIVKNYIAQLLKYIFERKQLDENIPVRFDYDDDIYDTSTTKESLNNSVPVSGSNGATTTVANNNGNSGNSGSAKFVTTNSGAGIINKVVSAPVATTTANNPFTTAVNNPYTTAVNNPFTTAVNPGVITKVDTAPVATTTVADYPQCN
jgi:hypothetical protein